MPRRINPGTIPDTKLARVRMSRRVSQEEMADALGISVPTYRRLERNKLENPGLRYLVNAALALGVELEDLIEDEWRQWKEFARSRPRPPDHREFWR